MGVSLKNSKKKSSEDRPFFDDFYHQYYTISIGLTLLIFSAYMGKKLQEVHLQASSGKKVREVGGYQIFSLRATLKFFKNIKIKSVNQNVMSPQYFEGISDYEKFP